MVWISVKKTNDNNKLGLHPGFKASSDWVLNDLFLTKNNMIPLSFSLIDLRQGYPEDFSRSSRSAYDEYYANYYKRQYEAYGGKDCSALQAPALYAYKGWMRCFCFLSYGCVFVYSDRSRWYDPNAAYDPRYKAYYDPTYGWYYDIDGYRSYYNQQYQNRYTHTPFKINLFFTC